MPYTLSHEILQAVLQKRGIKPNDLKGIDQLFGGADGYYWYHTMKHMCPKGDVIVWSSVEEMRAAIQAHEDDTAAEDEVKPQQMGEAHAAAIAGLLQD
jgi:hypothetical protein